MCDFDLKIKLGNLYSSTKECDFKDAKITFTKGENFFYRPTIEGEISFNGLSFNAIIESTKCCNSIPIKIEQICDGKVKSFYFMMDSSGYETDYKKNIFVSNTNTVVDQWRNIYYVWNEKVNALSVNRDYTVRHKYNTDLGGDTPNYIDGVNSKGIKIHTFIHHVLTETFKKIGIENIIPTNSSDLSTLFTSNLLPWNFKSNPLKNAVVFLVAEFLRPLATQSTGLDELTGKLNEDSAITLKELLSSLEMFKLFPFINENGKFQIEHISYFKNGNTYGFLNEVGIDLRLPKFSKFTKYFDYSHKNDFSQVYNKVTLVNSLNEELNNNENAFPEIELSSIYTENEILKINLFSKDSRNFNFDCSLKNEKNEPQEKIISYDFFYTYSDAVILAKSINELGWVLLECDGETIKENFVGTVNIKNGNLSMQSIYSLFHVYEKKQGFILDNTNYVSNNRPKYKLNPFSIPLDCLDYNFNGIHYLPDGRNFFIDKYSINLQDNTIEIESYFENLCGELVIGTNGCPVADILLSSITVPNFEFINNEIVVTYKSINTYSDGKCGIKMIIE